MFDNMNWKKLGTQFLFYAFVALVFAWTMSLTIGLAEQVFPGNWLAQYFAVALFDLGAIAWLFVFLHMAEGNWQRIEAVIMCALDMLGMAFVAGTEILLGGQKLVTVGEHVGQIALFTIGFWTVTNALGALIFHLLNPRTIRDMNRKTYNAKLDAATDKKYSQKIDGISEKLADERAELQLKVKLKELQAQYEDPEAYRLPAPSTNGRKDESVELRKYETVNAGNPTTAGRE